MTSINYVLLKADKPARPLSVCEPNKSRLTRPTNAKLCRRQLAHTRIAQIDKLIPRNKIYVRTFRLRHHWQMFSDFWTSTNPLNQQWSLITIKFMRGHQTTDFGVGIVFHRLPPKNRTVQWLSVSRGQKWLIDWSAPIQYFPSERANHLIYSSHAN